MFIYFDSVKYFYIIRRGFFIHRGPRGSSFINYLYILLDKSSVICNIVAGVSFVNLLCNPIFICSLADRDNGDIKFELISRLAVNYYGVCSSALLTLIR